MHQPKNLLLVYFRYERHGYIPLDIGYAAEYLRVKNPNAFVKVMSLSIKKSRIDYAMYVDKVLSNESDTVIFFIDNILWSGVFHEGFVEKLSKRIKKYQSKIQIGIQSYKMRDTRSILALQKNPQIDFILRGEPEESLVELLAGKRLTQIHGLSFRYGRGIRVNPESETRSDLSTLPSPYLSGLFDQMIERIVAVGNSYVFLVASRGCPYRCHYCFRSAKFSSVRTFPAKRVVSEIKYLHAKGIKTIFFLDDTFGPNQAFLDELTRHYQKTFRKKKGPELMVMTRPELLTPKTFESFAKLNVKKIQIGLQTINPDLQYLMTRASGFESKKVFSEIAKLAKRHNIQLWLDVIFALPGDTLESFKKSLDFAISLAPWYLQVKQLYFNPDTLFEIHPERYGIKHGKKSLNNVPYVVRSRGWTPQKIRAACEYAFATREKHPEIGFKIYSEYGFCYDQRR